MIKFNTFYLKKMIQFNICETFDVIIRLDYRLLKLHTTPDPFSGIIDIYVRWIAERQIQIKYKKYLIFMKSQVQYIEPQLN